MRKNLILFIVLTVLMLFAYQQKIPHILLGKYLSPSSNLTQADAIVVVSGDDDRIKHAIDLYKQGIAPKLILSGAAKDGLTSNALAMHLEASKAGIPNKAVIIVLSNNIRNIILVSSPYHQRRVYETFRSVFKKADVKLQNSPSPYSTWKVDSWWQSERELHLTQEETLKVFWANVTGSYR